jgi:hypothetical protein
MQLVAIRPSDTDQIRVSTIRISPADQIVLLQHMLAHAEEENEKGEVDGSANTQSTSSPATKG